MKKDELTLRDYLLILEKRKWMVIGIFSIFVISVSVVTFTMTPVYKATAQLYIDTSNNNPFAAQQGMNRIDGESYVQTQVNILRSENIARRVIRKLELDKVEGNKKTSMLASLLGSGGGDEDGKGTAPEVVLSRFMKRLSVEVVKNSNLVKVGYESEDPELSATVANEAVQSFIEQNLEMKVGPAKEYMAWLDDELGKIKERMGESSSRLEDFKRQRDLIVTGVDQPSVSIQALTDMNAKVLAAEARRYQAEIKYRQVQQLSDRPDGLYSIPDVINNKLIQDIKSQESMLAKEVAEQSKKFGEKHPQMVRLRNEMDTLKAQMKNEVGLIVDSLRHDYEQAMEAEKSLRRAMGRQRAEAMSYERRSAEYELKKQDVEGAKQIYEQVLKKFQENNVMGTISVSSVQLFDKAVPPKKPSRPKKALNLMLGVVLGLCTAVGFAIISEHLDNTYSSPEELEESLGLPILGVVPRTAARDPERPEGIVAVSDPISPMAESFRTIRSNILLSRRERTPRIIQVCSALHSEGKSTVSVNLACIMAAAGEKTVLIDGDMRRPRLHKVFNVQNARGLSSALTGKAELDDVIKKTSVFNVSFIPSGPLYSNPAELLGSARMLEVAEALKERFERVIIDCPPYLGIADASLLTPLSDGVVVVVRSGKTIKDAVLKIKKGMDNIRAEILGVVLNDMPARSVDYYYHYNYTNYMDKSRREGN